MLLISRFSSSLDTPGRCSVRSNRYRRHWGQRRKTILNLMRWLARRRRSDVCVDAHADAMWSDAVSAIGEASSEAVKFGYYTSVIVFMMRTRRSWTLPLATQLRR